MRAGRRLAVLAAASAALVSPAAAHDWYANKRNPVTRIPCCDDLDCNVIEHGDWWRKDERYFVRWTDGRIYSIPVVEALPSEDHEGKAAACVLEGWLRCFFVPSML